MHQTIVPTLNYTISLCSLLYQEMEEHEDSSNEKQGQVSPPLLYVQIHHWERCTPKAYYVLQNSSQLLYEQNFLAFNVEF